MSYVPVIPLTGYAGWKVLNRTMERQEAAFTASKEISSDVDYFRSKISSIKTAEDLVADRKLLKVALGAFGLSDDINNKYFIKKVLEECTLDTTALANKLSDKRYLELSEAFGFGDFSTPNTALSDFPEKIVSAYQSKGFAEAVGQSNSDYRLALNFQSEFPKLAEGTSSVNTKWYTILGSEPLREVFSTALGLPESVAALDIDAQLGIFKKKADAMFGSDDPAELGTTSKVDDIVKSFLLRSSLSGSSTSSTQSSALQLLSGSGSSSSILSILL